MELFNFLNALFKSIELNMKLRSFCLGERGMSNGIKQISYFGVAGVLIAVVIIAGFLAGTNLIRPVNGKLTIEIMDKPVELKHLNMTIDWVKIKDENGNWTDLYIENPNEQGTFYFDLLALQNVSETLL